MGAVYSCLRDVYHLATILVASIAESSADSKELLERIARPRLPVENSTKSFWQQRPPFPKLVDIKSDKLPASADIVIIGSGMSGASIAHTILQECRFLGITKRVVLVEGRTICSGATGRNGGHIKASSYAEYAKYKKRFGEKSAKKILAFYMKHLPLLTELTRVEGYEKGEARQVLTVDAFTEPTMMRKATEMVELLRTDLPEIAKGIEIIGKEELQERFGFSGMFEGGITSTSGAMWPYRFVTSVFESLLSKFPNDFSLETGTMVELIECISESDKPFLLKTSRGEIAAAHVIHATDAFAAKLVPGLKGKIFPVRGHMSAQRPGKAFPRNDGALSWSVVGKNDYEYISQRPGLPDAEDGLGAEIMIGGGATRSDDRGIGEVGQWGDDEMVHPIGSYLAGTLSLTFSPKTWGEDADGLRVKSMWTGIMGFTADMMPFIGQLSPKLTKRTVKRSRSKLEAGPQVPEPSEWICAGFNGSGMVLTWLSGVAVGLMVLGRENVESEGKVGRPDGTVHDWLPEEFICSPQRIFRSSIYEFPKLL